MLLTNVGGILPYYTASFPRPVVPKVSSTDPEGSAACFQRIRGYISVMTTLQFT
jgi:hypothetical protein